MSENPLPADQSAAIDAVAQSLAARYDMIRSVTLDLCADLEPEDFVVQSMPDASPAKWHLAHTTWFFEHFVLAPILEGYERFDGSYHHLFNSYYYSAGLMHPRARRGLLSRPLVREIIAYRRHVDDAMRMLLEQRADHAEVLQRVELGLQHEQQHQELLLTDSKHLFSLNPLRPPVRKSLDTPPATAAPEMEFLEQAGGAIEIGAAGNGFCFDNETPRHSALIPDHAIASRLVTNAEYREFMKDKGYARTELWLSDGWAAVQKHSWNRPLSWDEDFKGEFTLGGTRAIGWDAPVVHLSYYEADAFARWAGARLPTEAEWETAAARLPCAGNLAEAGYWHPIPATPDNPQFFGDAWEWTASPYAAYPGFRPLAGSLGEYNGKFMCNQMTVRGGSCVTPDDHIRASYRSFFYPEARWQFLGIRLARDLH
jgi:ergothioneine biosynthesis protein EgtB